MYKENKEWLVMEFLINANNMKYQTLASICILAIQIIARFNLKNIHWETHFYFQRAWFVPRPSFPASTSRPTFSQFLGRILSRSAFPNYIDFADRLILRLKHCEKVGRVIQALGISISLHLLFLSLSCGGDICPLQIICLWLECLGWSGGRGLMEKILADRILDIGQLIYLTEPYTILAAQNTEIVELYVVQIRRSSN